MQEFKTYVAVEVLFDKEGNMTPLTIIWDDGTRYPIDKVLDCRRAASLKAGGMGIRYTIRIQQKERYLFFETGLSPERWFVENKDPRHSN